MNTFIVIPWPDVQDLMELEGFRENSALINDQPLLDQYGSSAYMVRETWLRKNALHEDISFLEGTIESLNREIETLRHSQATIYSKWCNIPRWIRKIFKAN